MRHIFFIANFVSHFSVCIFNATETTISKLEPLKADGYPVVIRLFPDAEHGIIRFKQEPDGKREPVAYESDYLPAQIEWLQNQNQK